MERLCIRSRPLVPTVCLRAERSSLKQNVLRAECSVYVVATLELADQTIRLHVRSALDIDVIDDVSIRDITADGFT